MKNKTVIVGLIAGLMLATAFGGCIGAGNGALTFSVKDSAVNYDHVYVSFTKVVVHNSEGNNTSEWTTIFEGNTTIDLVTLNASTARQALGTDSLKAGEYDKIWIYITKVVGVKGGNETEFKVPSNILKIQYKFEIEDGKTTEIVADFDLEHSIVVGGNATIFKPVLKKLINSEDDSDKDGVNDVEDSDDDDDGIEDKNDNDSDGNKKSDDNEIKYEDDNGTLAVSVKDSLAGYDKVLVSFTEVRVHREDAGNESGWITVFSGNKTIDLLKLNASTARETLGVTILEIGNYSKIWIVVSKVVGVKGANETVFKVPSGILKIQYRFT
ncbi:MAG: DUF4382 domain-containing protein, partial [Candidatus Thermoplasmatota archaeon]|nr:DUF4382 domain-containing protein [Candidatus Thermoplasmatota archaeon]